MAPKSHLLPNKIKPFIIVFVVAVNAGCKINAAVESPKAKEYENDRVIKLPGQPNVSVSHFSGYITVNEAHERALFYWFFEAQSHPINKPLLLWLNGGPGCSSIGYGAAVELGPLRVGKKGDALEFNKFSWNKEANLLFLESPIGVGFSYTNTSDDFYDLNDSFIAVDAYNFLVKWLERFPQFKSHDFYISGESYAGHYVPQLAELVYDRNRMTTVYPYINLKGYIVGNPETNDYFDSKGIVEYAWSHSVISDEQYDNIRRACDFRFDNWSRECNKATNAVWKQYKEIDIYNIYAPSCLTNNNKTSQSHADEYNNLSNAKVHYYYQRFNRLIPGGYDPCYSQYTEAYFNRIEVQRALHVKSRGLSDTVEWKVCNDTLFRRYNYTVFSILPVYEKLVKAGLKIWIYSGDADGRVPVIGSRYCVEALKLPLKTPWTTWFYDHQVAGRIVEYEGVTLVTSLRASPPSLHCNSTAQHNTARVGTAPPPRLHLSLNYKNILRFLGSRLSPLAQLSTSPKCLLLGLSTRKLLLVDSKGNILFLF
ncbi:Serine carboxypeptidase-like 33 [Striga hermonthica]|uniref:Carboxypeptidase n=1 Tax=Striga hermonthica TaxID=68872 RepID=A0A9N7RSD2_STRHE|nr:Serine carboxypeptidase-like 33 [Striga hermonthica]